MSEKTEMPTISEQMDAIINEICENYCKYPDVAKSEAKDVDYADDLLYDKYCANCPMNKW